MYLWLLFFQEGQDTFYSVKYEMKEGNCAVQSGKTWQDCDYKEPEQAVSVMVQSPQFSQSRLQNYSISAGGDEYCWACLWGVNINPQMCRKIKWLMSMFLHRQKGHERPAMRCEESPPMKRGLLWPTGCFICADLSLNSTLPLISWPLLTHGLPWKGR